MSGTYHAVKRALKEVYKEETINVNLVEIESMKIADSTGTIINPATKENQQSMIDKLTSIDGKITKCDTDKTKIVDSTGTYTLVVDDVGRATTVSATKAVYTGSVVISAGASATTTLTVNATDKVAVYITVRDYLTGWGVVTTKLEVRVVAQTNVYEYTRLFCGGFHIVLDGSFDSIKIFASNLHRTRDIKVEWRVFAW